MPFNIIFSIFGLIVTFLSVDLSAWTTAENTSFFDDPLDFIKEVKISSLTESSAVAKCVAISDNKAQLERINADLKL
jgi:hypothetical protein